MQPRVSAHALMSAAAEYSAEVGAPKAGARMSNLRVNIAGSVEDVAREGRRNVEGTQQPRRRVDDVRDRVDHAHRGGRHGGVAGTMTLCFPERHRTVDIRIAFDVDAIGCV